LEGQLASPTLVSVIEETSLPHTENPTLADPHYLQTLIASTCGYCNDEFSLESCNCVYAQFLRTVLTNFRFVATSNWEKCDTLLQDILANEQANKKRRITSTPVHEPHTTTMPAASSTDCPTQEPSSSSPTSLRPEQTRFRSYAVYSNFAP
jgi:hypothetical protein